MTNPLGIYDDKPQTEKGVDERKNQASEKFEQIKTRLDDTNKYIPTDENEKKKETTENKTESETSDDKKENVGTIPPPTKSMSAFVVDGICGIVHKITDKIGYAQIIDDEGRAEIKEAIAIWAPSSGIKLTPAQNLGAVVFTHVALPIGKALAKKWGIL